ncbi:MAG: glycosyltransferase, partial [Alphaproteobacteria bacterium]
MTKPIVSVNMPVFNCVKFLPQAIDSILNQTFQNFELLIDSTGSTDGTSEMVESYQQKDKRIIHESSGQKIDICTKCNHIANRSVGKYLSRMDGDDISLPQRFEKQVAYLDKHPDIAVLGCNDVYINQAGKVIGYNSVDGANDAGDYNIADMEIKHPLRDYCTDPNKIVDIVAAAFCPIENPAMMMRFQVYQEIGGYRKQFSFSEDLDLWMRLNRAGYRFMNLRDILFHYRIGDNNSSRRNGYKVALQHTLLRQSQRDIMDGKPDPLHGLQEGDFTIDKVKALCRDSTDIVKYFSGILYGILRQVATAQFIDAPPDKILMADTIKLVEQMMNN